MESMFLAVVWAVAYVGGLAFLVGLACYAVYGVVSSLLGDSRRTRRSTRL